MSRPTSRSKKLVFVTGGVVSSLGKGIAASALGALLEARGIRVGFMKLDPYLNVDPGTMSPTQHGEVFVTDDGAETDLDLGHYERFTTAQTGKKNNFTTGQIYQAVLANERVGKYLGKTVQVIPHVTDEIKRCIALGQVDCDVLFVEIGGTVGDIESLPFLEAIRQLRTEKGPENTLYMHVTLVPYIAAAGELKTKPTQHSVRELRALGIQPDLIICRSDRMIGQDVKDKIALFCSVNKADVIACPDSASIYEVPMQLHREGADDRLLTALGMEWTSDPDLTAWKELLDAIHHPTRECTIAVVGKYTELADSYKSLNEALMHGGYAHRARVHLRFVESGGLTPETIEAALVGCDAILVPGGFGERGVEGKIQAVRFARERQIPFFGICLGMQVAVIEYARHVAGLTGAHSTEFASDATHPVVALMPEQVGITDKGATMRLGAYPCLIAEGTRAHRVYGSTQISERHRHRYEFNNDYRERLQEAGLTLSGLSPDARLVEMVELAEHPWFIGVQFHPEFKSRPTDAHPLFRSFVQAALEQRAKRL